MIIPSDALALLADSITRRNYVGAPSQSFATGEEELFQRVVGSQGKVDSATARSFVNNALYGGFDDIRPGFSIRDLDVETRLNLYSSFVSSAIPDQQYTKMLAGLHETLGFENELAAYGARQDAVLERALANKREIEVQWKQEGRNGTFADSFTNYVLNFQNISADEKIVHLQFLENVAAKAQNREPLKVVGFFDENQNSIGVHTGKEIRVNTNSHVFANDAAELVNTVFHEGEGHQNQELLGRKVLSGEIKKGDSNYVVARIFAAQMLFGPAGYIAPKNALGSHEAYANQPIEVDARRAGENGAAILYASYGLTPLAAKTSQLTNFATAERPWFAPRPAANALTPKIAA
jgi:hypothetical protein